jgi:hypothetical protein
MGKVVAEVLALRSDPIGTAWYQNGRIPGHAGSIWAAMPSGATQLSI